MGRFSRAMTFAMVKVLPEPVTPSSTLCFFPASRFAVSFSMAGRLVAAGFVIGFQNESAHDVQASPLRAFQR